ncbi:flagellar biosynthesis protein FlhB [Fusibacter ferrireducens]|uniref:Flagellar biosynthetic protein FlhB n=1 Tax=Fusibacter ferrireducens TaxID=2785058 RepID=A0ABR9ZNN9_9FIRM|nr:flagellar biosynthesis protein FlhB [Fusibacter ferrireducens]MBF4691743.1 flagellar biosynthesis protein FlhB [Fusibacter ferrireducens]
MILKYNLQLFSEEKTEQPTSKKIRDARQKGQVAKSKDLAAAVGLLAVFFTLSQYGSYMVEQLFGFFYRTADFMVSPEAFFVNGDVNKYFSEILFFILKLSLPLLGVALIAGVLTNYAQIGFLFSVETIQPKLSKINPLKGFKNMFSMKSLVELVKSVTKSALLLYVAISYVRQHLKELILVFELQPRQTVAVMWNITYGLVIRCAIFLFIIALFDFAYQKWKNNKDLMMSKQEIKDEYKQSEGDPQLKAKIKEKQRAFAMSRMMQEVPKADVIITNPTHFAVALKYDQSIGEAPLVLAKGQDLIAKNIKKIAAEHEVPIVENKPLAQTLYKTVDIGEFIPTELYEAVAEVLAYVYNLKQEKKI